ncbi:chemotaxis protein CheW [Paenibacillus eucommiae]|uniref:Purine-binding chemotaxis protein CheW n=1 Tax=Paenibacillus eucommiae TaxID=1355755 RepID=A0ABS4IN58_9BACL|nr:chemotaxis protein CheW [Paenibacillus eucommiae]MBP1989004.1 purine-binding chemotaxis protein CheW [Paenibacillus eucommiae]
MVVGKESYAINIQDIHEIIRLQPITDIPNCNSYVRGVINLRGKVVPVVSLRNLFGMSDIEGTKSTRIVVIKHKEESVGIIVDHVSKVTSYAEIQAPPEQVGGIHGAYFLGIGIREGNLVGILKMNEVLLQE